MQLIAKEQYSTRADQPKGMTTGVNDADVADRARWTVWTASNCTFPFTDGRAFSQARLLRRRRRFQASSGPRATCWSTSCCRCSAAGFDNAVLREDQNLPCPGATGTLCRFKGLLPGRRAVNARPFVCREAA